MKHTVRLSPGHFVHLDTYRDPSMERGNVWVVLIGLVIASLTVGAVLGMDITSPNTVQPSTQVK